MSDPADILIVDDEELICFVLTQLLRVHGFNVRKAAHGEEALEMIRRSRPDLVLLDIRMPGLSGFDVLHRIRETDTELPVILMTALSSVRDAVEGIKAGAFDYVSKPFDNNEMVTRVRRALARAAASEEDGVGSGEEDAPDVELHPLLEQLATGEDMRCLARAAQQFAHRGAPCLVRGEIGSGKRRFARIMHEVGEREGPMLVIECTGASESLLRAELYGSGSATGPSRAGKIELLRGGTLLLEDVDEMPASLQEVLARDFARGKYTHPATGATKPLAGMLLCATTRTEAADSGITADLLALIDMRQLRIPSMRERREDIPALVRQFVQDAAEEFDRDAPEVSPAAMEMLTENDWPGNVHQLKATVRRAVFTASADIEHAHVDIPSLRDILPAEDYPPVTVTRAPLREQVKEHIADVERKMLLEILHKTGWNKAKASRLLGITYKTMLKKVGEYGLESGKRHY